MNINIPPWLQDLFEDAHPDCGPTQHDKAKIIREDLRKLYRQQRQSIRMMEQSVLIPELPEPETARDITIRIAGLAPAIDPQNRTLIARNVQKAQDAGKWNREVEDRLVCTLNEPFDNVRNAARVQNRRIADFFEWHLDFG